ncbi:hypothetical protein [Kitasatospora sp. NPDC088783]|uniref:hypothetical protein n=1 Tax=Kitasatospora sp. NPDC088783 TaxID=3364077 RepID=UPI0038153969
MPEHYSSIGEAVGAAMQHNIRLAYGPGPGPAPHVRYFPPPDADPYSMTGMIARLEVSAHPDDVAAIVEETTRALVGPLPQLTELVAATADWTRARLDFDDPDTTPAVFDLWTKLASVHSMLAYAKEELENTIDGIAALPAETSDPRHHTKVQVKRTRELLHDLMDAEPGTEAEAKRQHAALFRSSGRRSTPRGAEPAPPAVGTTAQPPAADRSR